MQGPYLEQHEMAAVDRLMKYIAGDTINCWIRTRLKGRSASMSADGNISMVLLRELDKKLEPYVERMKQD